MIYLISNIYTFDIEVTKYDWLVVFKSFETKQFSTFHNDMDSLQWWINEYQPICGGFNNKHYDNYIMKGILAGFDNPHIKNISDMIIVDSVPPWEIPELNYKPKPFESFDLLDDAQDGTSLKGFEAHYGMDITETTVSFDVDHPWTDEEYEQMLYYCKFDVDATEKLLELRIPYLENKIKVGQMAGLDPIRSIYMTNAKLTAEFLQAKPPKEPRTDERDYVYPEKLKREYIPKEVFDYFDRMYDKSISDSDLYSEKLSIKIGDSIGNLGFGGIHTAIPHYMETETDTRIIVNVDVGSYYPNTMRLMGYMSRNIPDPQIYFDMLQQRMEAKARNDKVTANALKLVANTTYGATLYKFNPLYDSLMARSVCITGQLFLLELTNNLIAHVKSLKVIQTNTDGIMVSLDKEEYQILNEICQEWQDRLGYTLEEDRIHSIIEKDVNNYIEVQTDGTFKLKGGYLVRGIATAGAFKINNTMTIVSDAIVNYFVNNIPVEQTIMECNDISKFMLIAKAGSKYDRCYQLINGKEVGVQKCNRVYASKIYEHGTLYKVKKDGSVAKIESLPKHCLIDNDNHLRVDDVDKYWYVRIAQERVNDFLGIKRKINRRKINKLMKGILDAINL